MRKGAVLAGWLAGSSQGADIRIADGHGSRASRVWGEITLQSPDSGETMVIDAIDIAGIKLTPR
jgi:hypothetical protein